MFFFSELQDVFSTQLGIMNPELSDGMAQRPLLTGSTLRLASVILDVFLHMWHRGRERGAREREREREREGEREREMYILYIYIYIHLFIYSFTQTHHSTHHVLIKRSPVQVPSEVRDPIPSIARSICEAAPLPAAVPEPGGGRWSPGDARRLFSHV